jgi:hypothetical protein
MILKLNIKELVGVTPPATPSFNASADEYSDEVRISLEIGGVVIYSGLIKDFTYTYDAASFTQYVTTTKGQNLKLTSAALTIANGISTIELSIPQLEISDCVNVRIGIFSFLQGLYTWNTLWMEDVKIFGYDTEFDIIVSKNFPGEIPYYYATAVVIDEPFSNRIWIYKNNNFNNSFFWKIALGDDEYEDVNTSIELVNKENEIRILYNGGYETTINHDLKVYYPTFENSIDSSANLDNFVSVSGNKIYTTVNFTSVSIFKQDAIEVFPCKFTLVTQTVNNGEESNTQLIEKSPADASLIEEVIYEIQGEVTELDITINCTLDILGEEQLITSGDIEAGEYYVFGYDDLTVDLGDVDIDSQVIRNGRVYIKTLNGGTPLWDNGVILIKPLLEADLEDYKSYKIVDIVSGSDYSVDEFIDGSFPVQGTNLLGFVGVVPIITFSQSLNMQGVLPYTITKDGCNKVVITNFSNIFKLRVSVYAMIDNGDISNTVLITNDLNIGGQEDSSDILTLTADNIYKIKVNFISQTGTIREEEFEHYIVIGCNFETCLLKYLNELICCDTTNCDTNIDCKCLEKNYYDFNAFSTLMHTAIALMNEVYIDSNMFRFLIDNAEVQNKITRLHNIRTILFRAEEYCLDCQKINSTYSPCKGC